MFAISEINFADIDRERCRKQSNHFRISYLEMHLIVLGVKNVEMGFSIVWKLFCFCFLFSFYFLVMKMNLNCQFSINGLASTNLAIFCDLCRRFFHVSFRLYRFDNSSKFPQKKICWNRIPGASSAEII